MNYTHGRLACIGCQSFHNHCEPFQDLREVFVVSCLSVSLSKAFAFFYSVANKLLGGYEPMTG